MGAHQGDREVGVFLQISANDTIEDVLESSQQYGEGAFCKVRLARLENPKPQLVFINRSFEEGSDGSKKSDCFGGRMHGRA